MNLKLILIELCWVLIKDYFKTTMGFAGITPCLINARRAGEMNIPLPELNGFGEMLEDETVN